MVAKIALNYTGGTFLGLCPDQTTRLPHGWVNGLTTIVNYLGTTNRGIQGPGIYSRKGLFLDLGLGTIHSRKGSTTTKNKVIKIK